MDQEKLDKWRKLCDELVTYTQNATVGTLQSKIRLNALEGKIINRYDIHGFAPQISAMLKEIQSPKAKAFIKQLREFY